MTDIKKIFFPSIAGTKGNTSNNCLKKTSARINQIENILTHEQALAKIKADPKFRDRYEFLPTRDTQKIVVQDKYSKKVFFANLDDPATYRPSAVDYTIMAGTIILGGIFLLGCANPVNTPEDTMIASPLINDSLFYYKNANKLPTSFFYEPTGCWVSYGLYISRDLHWYNPPDYLKPLMGHFFLNYNPWGIETSGSYLDLQTGNLYLDDYIYSQRSNLVITPTTAITADDSLYQSILKGWVTSITKIVQPDIWEFDTYQIGVKYKADEAGRKRIFRQLVTNGYVNATSNFDNISSIDFGGTAGYIGYISSKFTEDTKTLDINWDTLSRQVEPYLIDELKYISREQTCKTAEVYKSRFELKREIQNLLDYLNQIVAQRDSIK